MKMKKIFSLALLIILMATLTGCQIEKQENSTEGKPEATQETEAISDDDSLEVINNELDKTRVNDFTDEINNLDQEINQL